MAGQKGDSPLLLVLVADDAYLSILSVVDWYHASFIKSGVTLCFQFFSTSSTATYLDVSRQNFEIAVSQEWLVCLMWNEREAN